MKRLAILLLAGLLMLCACGRPEQPSEPAGTDPATPPAAGTPPTVDETDYAALLDGCFSEVAENVEADFTVTDDGEGVTVTAYLGAGGRVRVPERIGGKPVTGIGDGAFANRDDLETVILPDTVTAFGSGIFAGTTLTALRTMLPAGEEKGFLGYFWGASSYRDNAMPALRSLRYLEIRQLPGQSARFVLPHHACFDCAGLVAVRLPVLTAVGDDAFAECSDLRYLNAEDFSEVGDRAFRGCGALQSLAFGDRLTRIGFAALRDCRSLMSLSLPFIGETEEKNTFLGYLFGAETPTLASGFYPPFLRSIVLSEKCSALPAFALFECRSLQSLTLPSTLTSIGACAMHGCTHLSALVIPDACRAIGDEACAGCVRLASVTYPSDAVCGLNVFLGCPFAESK